MIIGIVIGGVVLLLLFYVVFTYNSLKKLQVRLKASIQEIGNQLKRQASLIPNLESSVKAAASHEKEIYQTIATARAGINSAVEKPNHKNIETAMNSLQGMMAGMKVVLESNPQLQANQNFSELMNKLEDTADKIMYSRRLLIDLTAKYNELLEVFPSNLIARMFGFKSEKGLQTPEQGEHLQVSDKETQNHQVSF